MADVASLLDAGALIPVKQKIDKKQTVDEVSARAYRHAALGDRPVVRLSADKLAEGDNLVMEFLGFEAPDVNGPLAYRRRQALGFPGWALINDPDHARYALDLVKEFKKEARRAKSKPGHAQDGFENIAKQLGRSVAHFLPSFWEEVGREFMQLGNTTYAARAFGKAREAERVHALDVDENLRRDAFLEFALAGCLTNKSLTEYGKELQQSHSPEEAWSFFRELCVRRTLGGMPPWSNMDKDLKRLITAAGLDEEKETLTFLEEILDSPAMSRAAGAFWKGYGKALQKLATSKDHVAGVLLNLFPETSDWEHKFTWVWVDYLAEWEILPNLWRDGVPEEAAPRGGAAAWFSRLITQAGKPRQRAFELLVKLSDCIRSDGKALKLARKRWGGCEIDCDLLDLALELKLPVADPEEDLTLDLTEWASPSEDAEDRPRDPVHVLADERFRPRLERAVGEAAGNAEFEAAAAGKKALLEARRAWLSGLIRRMAEGALPAAERGLNQLGSMTTRATFQEFPETHDLLQNVDISAALVRTIRGGLIDEYEWPALEQAAQQLNPDGKTELRFFGSFPYAIVTNGASAIVVNSKETVHEHELRVPKGHKLEDMAFYDGHICVFLEKDYDNFFYWSNNPKKLCEESYHYGSEHPEGATVDMEDGGSFNGHRVVHAGDTKAPESCTEFLGDGEHFWRQEYRGQERVWCEVDPSSGKVGRKSLPSFLEDFLTEDTKLEHDRCQLLNIGDSAADSPLGYRDGLVGWRVRKTNSGRFQCEGIDGRKWEGGLDMGGEPQAAVGLLNLPGGSKQCPVSGSIGWSTRWSSTSYEIWDSSGEFEVASLDNELNVYNRGQATSLPPLLWHAFKVRDEKVSKKLRSLTNKQAQTLLKAVRADLTDAEDEDESPLPKTEQVLKKLVPALKSDGLRSGILGVVRRAGQIADMMEGMVDARDPEGEDAFVADAQSETLIAPAMKRLGIDTGYGEAAPLFPHLQAVAQFLAGEMDAKRVPDGPFEWFDLLGSIEVNAWVALWQEADEEGGGDEWLTFLDQWSQLPLHNLPGKMRLLKGEFDGDPPVRKKKKDDDEESWICYEHGGNRFVMVKTWDWRGDWTVLEYAPEGKFQGLATFKIQQDTELNQTWPSDRIRAFVEVARQNEKPFLPVEQLESLADRMGVSYAEAGLIWLGFPNFDGWAKNFLPKELREYLGVKVADADAARQSLKAIDEGIRQRVLSAMLDGDPKELWAEDGGAALERLVVAWDEIVPKRLAVPTKLVEQLDKVLGWGGDTGTVLTALASPKKHPCFTADTKWDIREEEDDYRAELHSAAEGKTFDHSILQATAICVPLLYYELPAGDAARTAIVDALAAAENCLKKPKLLLPLVSRHFYEKGKKGPEKRLSQLLGKVKKKGDAYIADDGLVVGHAEEEYVLLAFRPAKVKGEKEIKRLRNLVASVRGGDTATPSDDEDEDSGSLSAMVLLRSDGYKGIRDRVKKTPVPEGQFEMNPLLSAPELVEEVAGQRKLGEDAAVLYLQVLTLADPTSANVKRWNDWTTARYNKAAKELTSAELVLQAKRARAGRNHFLPGGWEPLKSPHLPIESWKLPLYQVKRDAGGQLAMPLPRILCLAPVHELFQEAWKRVVKGDEPRYEEVK